jgi:hypothetical protein
MPTIYVPEGGQTEQLKRENHKAKEAERREAGSGWQRAAAEASA